MPRRSPSATAAAATHETIAAPAAPVPSAADLSADLLMTSCSRILGLQSLAAGSALAVLATLQLTAVNPVIIQAAWSALYGQAWHRLADANCEWFGHYIGNHIELAHDFGNRGIGRTLSWSPMATAPLIERRKSATVINFPERRAQIGQR